MVEAGCENGRLVVICGKAGIHTFTEDTSFSVAFCTYRRAMGRGVCALGDSVERVPTSGSLETTAKPDPLKVL